MTMGLCIINLNQGSVPSATTNYTITCVEDEARSIHAVWASTTASFTIQPQVSLDGVNFINTGSVATVADNSSSAFWNQSTFPEAAYVRIRVVKTSGALTSLNIYVGTTPRG